MKTMFLPLVALFVCFLLLLQTGCSGVSEETGLRNKTKSRGSFTEIIWYGNSSKPRDEVAFVTINRTRDLDKWLDKDDRFRNASVVSSETAEKIGKILLTQKFLSIRRISLPEGNVQGYMLVTDLGDGGGIYWLGQDATTILLLKDLQTALPAHESPMVDRIITWLDLVEANRKLNN